MSREYTVFASQTITDTPGDTVLTIQSAVTIRPEITEFLITHQGTMTDATINWLIRRFDTDDGTGTALTPRPLDTRDAASAVTAQGNHTVEPASFTMTLIDAHPHLRGVFQWRARKQGLICPAVATEGIGLTPIHATQTNDCTATVWFTE